MDGEAPALIINKNVEPTWRELASSNTFRALVYPEVLRRLLSHIVEHNDLKELSEDTEESWESNWLRFAMYLGVPWPLSSSIDEAKENWVEESVRAFCRRHDFLKILCDSNINEN